MTFGSNDIKQEAAANSILITPPKNKELIRFGDVCNVRAQTRTYFSFKIQLQESIQNNINQITIVQYFTRLKNVVYD